MPTLLELEYLYVIQNDMIMKRHEGEIEPIVENECTVEQALVDTPTAFTSTSVNQTRWSDRIELEYIKVEWHMVATAVWQLTSETAGEI